MFGPEVLENSALDIKVLTLNHQKLEIGSVVVK